ncbi:MAG: cell division protein FtsZ [Candidatus Thermoplasmatota archaeon]|nr:cell division protein FtsZ [Candidatus Thermoplasmatota archaeon]MBU1914384.1 cell division protein FtsZ [Candidatus Thermoplasmatota archaeon]
MPDSLIKSALSGASAGNTSSEPQPEQQRTADDMEIEKIASQLDVCIKLVGCGGAGCNTVNRCIEDGLSGIQMLAINTDAKHLLTVKSPKKILIGKVTTRGLGAGARPEIGERAAMENELDIKEWLKGSQIVFITAGMGGGTGTSSSFVVGRVSKESRALTIGVVTLPFRSEGELRMENAMAGLSKLAKVCDTTIVIPNDTLIELVPNLPIQAAFKVADELLLQTIKGLTDMLTHAGLVNVDYADLNTILNEGGVSLIGVGDAAGKPMERIEDAVEEALNSPLLGKIDLKDARGALIRVVGGPDMNIEEAAKAAEIITDRIKPEARLIWGCSVEPEMAGKVKIMLIVTGARSQYVMLRDGDLPIIERTVEDYRGNVNVPPSIHQDEDLGLFVR